MLLHEEVEGTRRLDWSLGHHALEISPGEVGLDHFALELPDQEQLDALTSRSESLGVAVNERWLVGDHPPSGRSQLYGPSW